MFGILIRCILFGKQESQILHTSIMMNLKHKLMEQPDHINAFKKVLPDLVNLPKVGVNTSSITKGSCVGKQTNELF